MINTTVIGLGAMGAGIAGNLHRSGMLAAAWNRTHKRAEEVAARHGFKATPHLQAAVQCADLVITSVSADEDLLEMTGKIAPLLQAGNVVVDTSTVNASTAQRASEVYAAHGIHFLDAPVSGGKEGAEKGTMVMMVGGDGQVLQQILPALQAISSKVVHMGPVGSGQATKAVNQIMVAGINHAVTEALAFGRHQNLDMDKVIDVVSGGAAGNWFLQHRGRSMCEGSYAPGFKLALHHKDLKICQQMLAEDGKQLPVVEMTLADYAQLLQQGHADEDISILFHSKQALLGDA